MNDKLPENLCDVSAHCQSHLEGKGCVTKHFPSGVAECPDRLRILEQNATGGPVKEKSTTPA